MSEDPIEFPGALTSYAKAWGSDPDSKASLRDLYILTTLHALIISNGPVVPTTLLAEQAVTVADLTLSLKEST